MNLDINTDNVTQALEIMQFYLEKEYFNLHREKGDPTNEGQDPNPCVKLYGAIDGKKCKKCIHLYSKHYSKTYYKCDLRKDTNGRGTDHRVNWNACTKYEGVI